MYKRTRPTLGDTIAFTDESPCASIPAGDPYRKPGNYCATPDGGYTTFNADGSTFVNNPAGSAAPAMSPTTMIAIAGGAVLLLYFAMKD
jgi:hypothetical protein